MSRSLSRTRLLLAALVAAGLAAAIVAATGGAAAGAARTAHVVKVAKNAKLHTMVLVNLKGHTLYSLSAETRGRFICTNSCLSLWTPLVVPRGTKPEGAAKLATIKRPDGRIQVTYRGLPLYSFNEDMKPGDAKGNGFMDVGTWRVASVGKQPAPSPPPSGGYGGYPGY